MTHWEESVGCGSAAGAVASAVERSKTVVGDTKERARSSDTPLAIVNVATDSTGDDLISLHVLHRTGRLRRDGI